LPKNFFEQMENQQSNSQPPKDFIETYASALPDGPEKMYLLGRLKDQLDWYDNRSTQNKTIYRARKIRIIVLSALIPVAVGYAGEDAVLIDLPERVGFDVTVGGIVKLAVAIAGALVAIWEAISMFMKYRELWFNYRSASERLKQEAWKYVTRIGAYQDEATRFVNLVMNVEGIFEKESQQWDSLIKQESEKEKSEAIRKEVEKALDDMKTRIGAQKEGATAAVVVAVPTPAPTDTATPPATETSAEGEQTATPPADTAATSTETPAETPTADTELHGEEEETPKG
jgi:hypothetical protein